MTDARAVGAHYGRGGLEARLLEALREAGKDPERLAPVDLAPVDQFHIGGRDATLALARRAALERGARVLDVGGGLGGPARTLAAELGCRVTVVDLTEEFCRVGALLTERTGLADRVEFRHGDALRLPVKNGEFDVVWTQHSSMNIADKAGLSRELFRALRPGGRLAMHEILAGPEAPVHFPVPWASEPSLSHLETPVAGRARLTAAGFTEAAWTDRSAEAIAWFRERLSQPPAVLGLHLLLGPDAPAMLRNILRNLDERRVVVAEAVFHR
ncbi:MAG TPA: methyltransferase domain-containing protein [Methylomirabilota bacterium]|nr:methyltransferase domain-containing protein [Methylomirabilota bacterium]